MSPWRSPAVVDERGGSPSVEAALLAVVIGMLLVLGVAGGRMVAAESATDHAARAAARAASIERSATAAEARAREIARAVLDERALRCDVLDVDVDVSQFARPLGAPASVRAEVRCAVRWSDLGLPGAPGTRDVDAAFVSPIDQLRERQ
ncbi:MULTISPECIES: TadE/TadG family type IV pilus assembly protein [unclassified Pseudonocardia]|uniref:TadE/TadG family type IV pilus assembly protein n=1 Tax=unclassified Pseudonocardia TaxID=2619320 RepID=UPI00095E8C22|nr:MULTISPECIES: TadE/TadG family type IV pilus assembly protein [unclassified Pseudonocardia]MBN9103107.1 pilus assembly protein [Pseudonocardia sp.]OJY41582.1 MAG: hypothetical protein BGP03_20500 [Pseudonocardia sp. 73-21]